ncbi:MAG: DUF3021 domain-containing protein [Ruminococcus sp.]|nr:DUF3021 domain-containing protein [Ruminococcus sp.]
MKFKDIILATIGGIGIGMPITIICMVLIGGWNGVIKEFLVWLAASALFGVLSILFKSSRLPLPLITVIHCVGCLIITCGACAIIGYSDSFFSILPAVLPVFIVVYAVIYIVTLLSAKAEAKRINAELNSKN